MCLSPIRVKNPNKGLKHLSSLKDTESTYINVPCGCCSECVALRQMEFVQRCQMESINSFIFFSTLTYDNAHLPVLTTETGFEIPYADIRHLQLLFKRLRIRNSFGRPFRYFAVSERGKDKSRPHFHVLWFLPKYKGELDSDGLFLQNRIYDSVKSNWVVNVGSDKKPVYESLFTHHSRYIGGKLFTNYETHFVNPSLTSGGYAEVAFYCSKYLLKQNPKERRLQQALHLNYDEDLYEIYWNTTKSHSLRSKSFGLGAEHNREDILKYLKDCIAKSDRSLGYPCFFPPCSTNSFPLAHFYKSNPKIFGGAVAIDFVMNQREKYRDRDIFRDIEKSQQLEKYLSYVESKDLSLEFDFLDDE